MPFASRRPAPPVRLRRRRRHHRPRRPRWWARRLATGLAAILACVPPIVDPARPALAAEAAPLVHTPPVDAPVVDPFRPPAGPYGPGNRGIEYATRPGTAVRASAAGTVTFVGQVGGRLHVTVAHADGVRTSYSFLATTSVALGRPVAGGDLVGTAGSRLHFGARRGAEYIDPATLFGAGAAVVELLPLDPPTREERASPGVAGPPPQPLPLSPGAAGGAPLPRPTSPQAAALDWLGEGAGAVGSAGRPGRPQTARVLLDRLLTAGLVAPAGPDDGAAATPSPACSSGPPPHRPVAGERRVAVTVGGLGSTSRTGAIADLRTGELGYDPGRVVRFSYAGGRTPGTGDALGALPASEYTSVDTQGDVVVAGARLADLIEQVAGADPAATIDLYAHSLGGIAARIALLVLHDRGFPLDRLGVVVTLATPHGGADLATAVDLASRRPSGRAALAAAAGLLDTGLDPDATVVGQLAEGSAVVHHLESRGVPPGVRLISLSARGDLTVPSPRAGAAGATTVTLPLVGPSAHGRIVGSDEATAEIALALSARPPRCESWADAVADVVVGRTIAAAEDQLGTLASAGPW